MASFRHAVWPNINDTSTAETIWGSEVHPGWQVQQLLADTVVYYLEKSYARFCEVYGSADKPSRQEVSHLSDCGGGDRLAESLGCFFPPE